MSLRILFPSMTLYPDESGGISTSLYWLLKGLYASNKVELTIITNNYGIDNNFSIQENKWLNTDYGKVIYLKTKNHKIGIEIIKQFLSQVVKTDIIHLSSIFYLPSIIGFLIGIFLRKKIVWSTRGSVDDVEFKKRGFLKKITIYFLKPFTRFVTFHTTSDQESNFVRKQFGESAKIVQIKNYMIIPKKIVINKEDYFLYIGRFHHKKGIKNLIKALKISKLFLSSNYTLKIAGDYNNKYGQYIIELCKKLSLENKVIFLSHVGNDKKQELLAKSYFTFLPSFSENFGNVVVESLAQGTPVVTSYYTPWEILNQYQAGFWIDNTVQSLADIIDRILLLSLNEYNNYSKNASKLISINFDINLNINQWLNLYGSL